ncbi:MAG: elongation factor P maturation arginine rhamnosyltransferase EarP [Methylotenera sp.]|nr:elongation factor P maturation arginine rhamnosyltransferase EarP [Methylotenera sp.]
MIKHAVKRWDIFCKIVDNYGDIGVCWRLSRQLANEHSIHVRLIIDNIHVAQKIISNLDISKPMQLINQVEIVASACLEKKQVNPDAVDAVIETFGCGLPEQYLKQMRPETVWINLEYLSAEKWVSGFHAKPSKHPTLPLTKYFFFPGFDENTGGLIREKDLFKQPESFLNSEETQLTFWKKIGAEATTDLKISLFCYPQAPVKKLWDALAITSKPISLYLPFNSTIDELVCIKKDFKLNVGEILKLGNLTIHVLPFLSQDDYDLLLLGCDLNFVRGEDSWIRALWAGKPFIWQPYIQADDTHLVKLSAFLDFYLSKANPQNKTLIYDASLNWSGYGHYQSNRLNSDIWQQLIDAIPKLQRHGEDVTRLLSQQPDLATKLVIFSENLQRNQV